MEILSEEKIGKALRPDPRDYENPRDYLVDHLDWKRKINPNFSLRTWAGRMGFKNHSLLSLLLSGRREISPAHTAQLLRGLDLKTEEKKYFEALISLLAAKTDEERAFHEATVKPLLKSERRMVFKDVETFRFVSHWLHSAILEMTRLNDFQNDSEWIAKRLGDGMTATDISKAVQRLKDLNLLREDGTRLVKTNEKLSFGGERASQAVREYHRQTLLLATKAIEGQSKTERILNGFTMTIDSAQLPRAEVLIENFRQQMEALLEADPGDSTYQCNIQLFRLTRKKDCV